VSDRATINRAERDDIGVMPNDPLVDLAARAAETPAEKPMQPAVLKYVTPDRFRFRTTPGHRNTAIVLRVPEVTFDLDKNVRLKQNFERWAKRTFGKDFLKILKVDGEIAEILGTPIIKFRPLPGKQEATYETGSPEVAAYIRMRIKEPDHSMIYEDVKPMAVDINGETIYVVPADPTSRARMAAHAAGS